ncbi:MAG TPA: hypothetical protein VFI06_16080 [Chitinophagaceae bacterium]|nr:hypothetical protein [Chitinophagaceae bacterium]
MEIDINQKKISVGDKYKIFIDGQQTHYASRKLWRLMPEINLFDNDHDKPRMIINKRLSWFRAKYDITRWNEKVLEFRTKSYWKHHYQCQSGSDTYDVYGHRGRKYSIYKNDVQIAWWDKRAVTWFAGDNYKITADKDCDVDLIISFCLVVDNFSSDDHNGNAVTLNVGNIGFQVKKFDENWLPKF